MLARTHTHTHTHTHTPYAHTHTHTHTITSHHTHTSLKSHYPIWFDVICTIVHSNKGPPEKWCFWQTLNEWFLNQEEVVDITGWRRLIGSPKLQIIFHKRATKYRSLLRKMTYKDKRSYESSPTCTVEGHVQVCYGSSARTEAKINCHPSSGKDPSCIPFEECNTQIHVYVYTRGSFMLAASTRCLKQRLYHSGPNATFQSKTKNWKRKRVATCFNVWQCVAVCCSVF